MLPLPPDRTSIININITSPVPNIVAIQFGGYSLDSVGSFVHPIVGIALFYISVFTTVDLLNTG